MPETTTPTRTTSVIGDQTQSGVACTTCSTTYAACSRDVLRGRRACCGTCADTDTHDVEVVESPPPVVEPTPEAREVRQNALRVIHKTTAPPGRQHGVDTVCGANLVTTVADARRWRGGSANSTLTECDVCFSPHMVEPAPEPAPITAEVRSNANRTVHRTTDVDNANQRRYPIVSICGETMTYAVRDPRVWNGHPVQTITECTTCFETQPVPEAWTPTPGDFVTVTPAGQAESALRGWTDTTVFVYVGPARDDATNIYSTLVVRDGWEHAAHRTPLPSVAERVRLTDVPGIRFWNVRTDSLVPSLGFGLNEAQVSARNRLLGRDNPIQPCTHNHPADPHTHTEGPDPLWGRANSSNSGNVIRVVHPITGDYVMFAKGEHLIPNPDSLESTPEPVPVPEPETREVRENARTVVHRTTAPIGRSSVDTVCGAHIDWTSRDARNWMGDPPRDLTDCEVCFPTTTTERESTTVTAPAPRFPVGTDIYPIDGDKLRDLPPGSVLTIRSRDRGEMRGGSIHFGCQNWSLDTLAREQATIEFQPNSRAVVTADVAVVRGETGLLIAGQRQGLGDVNEYARSIIVKEVAVVPVQNALVMEHGFYGCVHHADHVLVVGNGRERNRGAVVPLVGQIRRVADGSHTLTGTVGVPEGLLHSSMHDCTPVFSSTSAYTMNFAAERRWSLVPATAAHIERMRERNRTVVTGHVENNRATLCTSTGAPVAAPAADPEPF